MITVKFYGLMRLESGWKQLDIDAKNTKELLTALERQGLDTKALRSCNILINGKLSTGNTTLKDGDSVQFFPPVAGG